SAISSHGVAFITRLRHSRMTLESTGCQPVLFGSLPKSYRPFTEMHSWIARESSASCRRQRAGSLAPLTTRCAPRDVTLFACAALQCRSCIFAIQLGNETGADLGRANRLTFVSIGAITESFCIQY